jgi:hypothetical protein
VGSEHDGAPAGGPLVERQFWSKVLDLSVNYQGREAKPPLSEANLTEQLEVGILCDLRLLEDGVFHCVRVWE